mgnify:FL=1
MKKIILVVVLAAALAGLTYIVKTGQFDADTPERAVIKFNNPQIKDKEVVLNDYVRYPGRTGKNAFDLLLEVTQDKVEFKRYDFGVFVDSINGVKPAEHQFWKLYLNGEEAQVGADSLETHKGDIIEWILEDIDRGYTDNTDNADTPTSSPPHEGEK